MFNIKQLFVVVFLILGLIQFTQANPIHFESGIGYSYSNITPDGVWYQKGLPHTINKNSPVFMLGITDDIDNNLSWHFDYVNLGSISVNSWDTYRDDYYDPVKGVCLQKCSPNELVNFIGNGSVYGFSATLNYHTQGKIQYGIEAGPFLYHAKWSVSVPNYYTVSGFNPSYTSGWNSTETGIYRSASSWKLGAVIGFTISYNNLTLSLNRYYDGTNFPIPNDGWPTLWRNQTVLMVSYKF